MKLNWLLIVEGKHLPVTNISLFQGEVTDVIVKDEAGSFKSYSSTTTNFEDCLVGVMPSTQQQELLAHLDDCNKVCDEELIDFALTTLSDEESLPFGGTLDAKQKEFRLMQERVFGFIDATEEVKVFLGGYYVDKK